MSFANYKNFIRISIFTFLLTVAAVAGVRAESAFAFNLDGAPAGTGSAATGFGTIVLKDDGPFVLIRLRFSGLSGPVDLDSGVRLVDENGTTLRQITMQTQNVSFRNEFELSLPQVEKLRQGQLFVKVATPNHPNGEIAGQVKTFSPNYGRVNSWNYFTGGNPNANGFALLTFDKNGLTPMLYYRYAGLGAGGNLVTIDSTVVDAGAPAAASDLIFLNPAQLSPTFYARLKKGDIVFSISRNSVEQARGFIKPLNKDVDFNGDNRADMAVFRPSNGNWYWLSSLHHDSHSINFGKSGDIPVPADFDADGLTDYAVWRPSNGVFYVMHNYDFSFRAILWGKNGDTPFAADFDGDGKADFAIYRPGEGNTQSYFWVWKNTGGYYAVPFGLGDDKPLLADFDGDRINDLSVFRPSEGTFYSLLSSDNSLLVRQWGISTDTPRAADFDGDGKSDYLVYRNVLNVRTWYILTSSSGYASYSATLWGNGFGKIQPADYTGDGLTDFGYYHNGAWGFRDSADNSDKGANFGLSTDIPLHGN